MAIDKEYTFELSENDKFYIHILPNEFVLYINFISKLNIICQIEDIRITYK